MPAGPRDAAPAAYARAGADRGGRARTGGGTRGMMEDRGNRSTAVASTREIWMGRAARATGKDTRILMIRTGKEAATMGTAGTMGPKDTMKTGPRAEGLTRGRTWILATISTGATSAA